ncbi:MalY/PatB family protein [Cellulomonas citrea]|uniref:MalY/PatB family protein n=1 Tax=Cellulomonas citrea TaxID=1909423 RepID=UPI001F3FE305|nr:aminotransferase class I/II-fold pyridoxal phosphate-dependent enzyme [Cellulomonas citrea]
MTSAFDLTLPELTTRTSAKWRVYPPDVLPLWVAEMDVRPVPAVVEAVSRAVAAGDTGYPGGTEYAEAYAAFAAERWGWALDPARLRRVPDVLTGIAELIGLLTSPGGAVVLSPPVYPPFFSVVEHTGRRVVRAPLGGDLRLDLDALAGAFELAGPGSVYLLCHPHNPTGRLHTPAELAAVGELARRAGVRVVSDEIHAALVLDGSFTPATTVIPDAFALHSASKTFNLAGLPSALLVPGPDATGDLARMSPFAGHGSSHLGGIAQAAALRDGGPWLDELLDSLRANVVLLDELLTRLLPAVSWTAPQATYLAWLDLRRVVPDGVEPARHLLDHARVAVNPGPTFGAEGAGFVRLNLATSPAILTEAVERIAAAVP